MSEQGKLKDIQNWFSGEGWTANAKVIGDAVEQIERLQKQADCTHHHNGIGQYSPFQHAWKCDKCDHIKQDE